MNHLLTAELGCGDVNDLRFDHKVDIIPYPFVTYNADFIALPKFGDNRFCLIKCAAALEHITPDEQIRAVKEWHRILCPNGIVLISTPDLDWIDYAEEIGKRGEEGGISQYWADMLRHGGGKDEYDVHKGLLNAESLRALFENNGYETLYLHDGKQAGGSLDAGFMAIK